MGEQLNRPNQPPTSSAQAPASIADDIVVRAVIDSSSDIIAAIDRAFRFIAINRACREEWQAVFGSPVELGQTLQQCLSHLPAEQEAAVRLCTRALEGERFSIEQVFGDTDRARKVYQIAINPLRDNSGALYGTVISARDITTRAEAEQKVARLNADLEQRAAERTEALEQALAQARDAQGHASRQAAELDAVIHQMSDGLIILDSAGRIARMNQTAVRLSGAASVEEARGRLASDPPSPALGHELRDVAGRPLDHDQWPIVRARRFEPYDGLECMISPPDGGEPWVGRFSGTPVHTPDGDRLFVVTMQDITEHRKAEYEQLETGHRLELALRSAKLGTWDVDVASGQVDWDQRCAEIFGRPSLRILDLERVYDCIHPDDLALVQHQVERALAGEADGAYEAEYRTIWPDDQVRWVYVRGQALFAGAGDARQAVRFIGTVMDFTEERQAEQALAESEARHAVVAENVPFGTWTCDAQGRCTYVTQSFLDMLGKRWPEVAEFGWTRFVHEQDVGAVRERWAHCVKTGEPWSFQYRIRSASGRWLWLLTKGRPLRDGHDRITGWAGIHLDVTEQQQTQRLLDEYHLFQAIIDNIPVMLCIYDLDGNVQLVNAELTRRLGWGSDEFGSLEVMQQLYPDPDYREQVWQFMTEGSGWADITACTRDGRELHTAWTNISIGGQTKVGIGLDMTDRYRLQSELEQTNQKLRALAAELSSAEQRERRRVAATLHDHLQQLLVAAKMGVDQLRHAADDPDQIHRVSDRLQELVAESIKASRTLTVELSPPVLYDAGLGAAMQWLARHFQERHGMAVTARTCCDQPPLSTDVQAFCFQAVRELLLNVVKHSGADRATIELADDEPDTVRITVSDNGDGCEPAQVMRPSPDASGFGLFNLHQRMELVGGSFELDSTPGGGCRVTLRLPAEVAAEESAEPTTPSGLARKARRERERIERRTYRVLLVDDHTVLREGLAQMLDGYEDVDLVGQAEDGVRAVEQALELEPDVVIMDITMPRMDGVEATRRITAARPQTRVVGLSMHEREDMARAMIEAGAATYLTKGGPVQDLLDAIRGHDGVNDPDAPGP